MMAETPDPFHIATHWQLASLKQAQRDRQIDRDRDSNIDTEKQRERKKWEKEAGRYQAN